MRTSLRCAEWTLMLEVIRNHDYCTQSRMLRGATIDESMLKDEHGAEATADASRVRCLHRCGRPFTDAQDVGCGCRWRCGLATSTTAESFERAKTRQSRSSPTASSSNRSVSRGAVSDVGAISRPGLTDADERHGGCSAKLMNLPDSRAVSGDTPVG
jgi:hypothetical protein